MQKVFIILAFVFIFSSFIYGVIPAQIGLIFIGLHLVTWQLSQSEKEKGSKDYYINLVLFISIIVVSSIMLMKRLFWT